MTRQLAYLANSAQLVLNSKSEIVNSRSPKFGFARKSSTNSPFSCKTNPICTNPEYALTSFSARAYRKNAKFSPTKAKPNKPKQSQSDPIFRPLWHPKAKANPSKPKQTQSNSKRSGDPYGSTARNPQSGDQTNATSSEPAEPTCSELVEPIHPGEALLPRRSPVRSRAGKAGSSPISNPARTY
jgi:hypothetical protein